MKQEMTHLHVHYDHSILDGYGTNMRTAQHAKDLGMTALGSTNHGVLSDSLVHIQTCKDLGLKPVTGMEGYVEVEGKRFHITLLADGNKGFKNLSALNDIGQRNYNKRPTFHFDDLTTHSEGLIIGSGCAASLFQDNEYSDAVDLMKHLLKNGYDKSSLFIELMVTSYAGTYGKPYDRSIKLHRDLGLDLVLTGDVHFAKKEDAQNHQQMMKMSSGFSYDSNELYLRTTEEIQNAALNFGFTEDMMAFVNTGIQNANNLASRLSVVQFDSTPKLPHIPNADAKLDRLVEEGFQNRVKQGKIEANPIYKARIHKEVRDIKAMGFSTYFLILVDAVKYANQNHIWLGPARGSGAGSLVLYLLGITNIDPIPFNLYWERFLNRKRSDMPDVDVDIESEGHSEMIGYMADKWGALAVATYSTYKHKSLTRDLSKSFRIDNNLRDEATEFGPDSDAFKQIVKEHPRFKEMYDAMSLQIRHMGRHAGGIVINEEGFPLPLIRLSNGAIVSAWSEGENKELSKVGLIKFDFLGVIVMSILHRCFNLTNQMPPDIPEDGDPVFELFRKKNTLGVFQFGSTGIQKFLEDVETDSIRDLIAVNALFRPGPLDSGAAFEYPALKKSGKQRKLHSEIDHILEETYGVIAYQEQYMQIIAYWLSEVGSFNEEDAMADADMGRKVLTKAGKLLDNPKYKDSKIVKSYHDLREQCRVGAVEVHGWTEQEFATVWDEIKTHAGYSFNKSHSVAYALTAWMTAWYKFHYPLEFYTASLNVLHNKPDKVEEFMFEAVLNGIKLLPPDINSSTGDYVCDKETNSIYLPITSVKYVADKSYSKLSKVREEENGFKSLEHYMEKVPKRAINKRGREGLLAMGAFDSIRGNESAWEVLGVSEVAGLTRTQIQSKYLGFVLPTKRFIEQKNALDELGYSVILIGEVITNSNSWGGEYYKVYKSDGNFAFWYTLKSFGSILAEGDFVGYKPGEKGQSKNIELVIM